MAIRPEHFKRCTYAYYASKLLHVWPWSAPDSRAATLSEFHTHEKKSGKINPPLVEKVTSGNYSIQLRLIDVHYFAGNLFNLHNSGHHRLESVQMQISNVIRKCNRKEKNYATKCVLMASFIMYELSKQTNCWNTAHQWPHQWSSRYSFISLEYTIFTLPDSTQWHYACGNAVTDVMHASVCFISSRWPNWFQTVQSHSNGLINELLEASWVTKHNNNVEIAHANAFTSDIYALRRFASSLVRLFRLKCHRTTRTSSILYSANRHNVME